MGAAIIIIIAQCKGLYYTNQISGKWLPTHAANVHILRVHQYALIEKSSKCAYCMALGNVLL